MEMNGAVEEFWAAYCATQPDGEACLRAPHDAWAFGDSPRMADELGALVLSGVKTATAGLVWEDKHFGWMTPTRGSRSIIRDGQDQPICIIEMTEVVVCPFNEVDGAFALLEGEGFTSVEKWRQAHWRYFSRRCREIGKEPSDRMPVLCQQFRVVYPR